MNTVAKSYGLFRQLAVLNKQTAQTIGNYTPKIQSSSHVQRRHVAISCKLGGRGSMILHERASTPLSLLRSSTVARSLVNGRRTATVSASGTDEAVTSHQVVTFYHFTDIEDPHALVEQHRDFMKERDVKGRIYINQQGINAQLSGAGQHATEYAQWVTTEDPRFSDCRFTVVNVGEHKFPRLSLRYKPNLVSLAGGTQDLPLTDPTQRAVKLPAKEFNQKLLEAAVARAAAQKGGDDSQGAGQEAVVLDVRNSYEWDTGHFLGAERPTNERFRDTELDADGEPLHNVPKDTPVLMYCTGGIRCDVYSAVLRQRGFTELYTLEGGVQAFLNDHTDEEREEVWDGELFVFDDRLATPTLESDSTVQPRAADRPCFCCKLPVAAPPHRNCANVDCNRLFLVCGSCLEQCKGYCTTECRECAVRGRPLISPEGRFTKWHKYQQGQPSMRGDGRSRRRRARNQRRRVEEVDGAIRAVERDNLTPNGVDALATGPGKPRHSRRKLHLMQKVARQKLLKGRIDRAALLGELKLSDSDTDTDSDTDSDTESDTDSEFEGVNAGQKATAE